MELHSPPVQRAVLLIRQTEDSIISHPGTRGSALAPLLCSTTVEDKPSSGGLWAPRKPMVWGWLWCGFPCVVPECGLFWGHAPDGERLRDKAWLGWPPDGSCPHLSLPEPWVGCCCLYVVVQSCSCVRPFATPGTAAGQASLSFTISWSLLKLMSIESVMPSHHLILCCPLLHLPSIIPNMWIFSTELLALCTIWPKYWKV